jgi:PIN domain nuclease of toxin-antitoxin system
LNCILDTHFLLWITVDAPQLAAFPWLERYATWGVSPVSFLEVQYLGEVGKLEVRIAEFVGAVSRDPRFIVDEVPVMALIQQALSLSWTRDPFDRLLAAHSAARRKPLCSVDRQIRTHHTHVPAELAL